MAGTVLLEARPYRPFKSSEEYLYAMREDLAEWLNTLYPELMINVDNFMDRLDTGVSLCKVSEVSCLLIFFYLIEIYDKLAIIIFELIKALIFKAMKNKSGKEGLAQHQKFEVCLSKKNTFSAYKIQHE